MRRERFRSSAASFLVSSVKVSRIVILCDELAILPILEQDLEVLRPNFAQRVGPSKESFLETDSELSEVLANGRTREEH